MEGHMDGQVLLRYEGRLGCLKDCLAWTTLALEPSRVKVTIFKLVRWVHLMEEVEYIHVGNQTNHYILSGNGSSVFKK